MGTSRYFPQIQQTGLCWVEFSCQTPHIPIEALSRRVYPHHSTVRFKPGCAWNDSELPVTTNTCTFITMAPPAPLERQWKPPTNWDISAQIPQSLHQWFSFLRLQSTNDTRRIYHWRSYPPLWPQCRKPKHHQYQANYNRATKSFKHGFVTHYCSPPSLKVNTPH